MNKPLLVANWKMNGSLDTANSLVKQIAQLDKNQNLWQTVICPPFTLLNAVADNLRGSDIMLGAQDCSCVDSQYGAYTGDISAHMLKEFSCEYVVLGHSERRIYHNETSEMVRKKAEAAHNAGLKTIICVGETQEIRANGETKEYIKNVALGTLPKSSSRDNTIIAYEPIWSIGTGLIPTQDEIQELFVFMNDLFASKFKLIYGGSVNHNNARLITSNQYVDGILVGGASLAFESFYGIIKSLSSVAE